MFSMWLGISIVVIEIIYMVRALGLSKILCYIQKAQMIYIYTGNLFKFIFEGKSPAERSFELRK